MRDPSTGSNLDQARRRLLQGRGAAAALGLPTAALAAEIPPRAATTKEYGK
jgi:hypothetical protein